MEGQQNAIRRIMVSIDFLAKLAKLGQTDKRLTGPVKKDPT